MCGGDSIKENNSYKRNNDDNVFLIASLLTYYKIKPEWTEINYFILTILQDILQLAELWTLTAHTESDENGLAIQKKFQVFGQSFQPIQCFLGPLIYPY